MLPNKQGYRQETGQKGFRGWNLANLDEK